MTVKELFESMGEIQHYFSHHSTELGETRVYVDYLDGNLIDKLPNVHRQEIGDKLREAGYTMYGIIYCYNHRKCGCGESGRARVVRRVGVVIYDKPPGTKQGGKTPKLGQGS
jgi:hypothetical protein